MISVTIGQYKLLIWTINQFLHQLPTPWPGGIKLVNGALGNFQAVMSLDKSIRMSIDYGALSSFTAFIFESIIKDDLLSKITFGENSN